MFRSMCRRTRRSNKGNMSRDDFMEDGIVELDNSYVEPDHEPPQEMGDPSVEVTEENREASQVSKSVAMDAMIEGKLDKAICHLTEAIKSTPKSPILYASRAIVFVKLKKPNAAIRDAVAALKIDADCTKGYKAWYGKEIIGIMGRGCKRLAYCFKSRFLRKIDANTKKIAEHHQKYDNLRREREVRKTEIERVRQLQVLH